MNVGSSIMPVDKLQNAISPNQMHLQIEPSSCKKADIARLIFYIRFKS